MNINCYLEIHKGAEIALSDKCTQKTVSTLVFTEKKCKSRPDRITTNQYIGVNVPPELGQAILFAAF